MKFLSVLPLVVTLAVGPGIPGSSTPQVVVSERVEGTIYVGDSRFNGMDMYTKKGQGFVVAKDSMGYSWLSGTAVYKIAQIKTEHPDVKNWTVISNLGVNDLSNVDSYIKLYTQMQESGDRVIVMLVNPTNRRRKELNSQIDAFNAKIRESGLEYFDMCSHLREVGFDTVDGLHYDRYTNYEIWNELNNYITFEEDNSNEKGESTDSTDDDHVFDGWLCRSNEHT